MNNNLMINIFIIMFSVIFADVAPAPPAIPNVEVVTENETVKLVWDSKAEESIDPLTKYSDFEGYRIYRSTDGGKTWGKSWNRIYDYSGNHVGWKPYAQFDLVEESDTLHCIYNKNYMGIDGELCYSLPLPLGDVPTHVLDDEHVNIVNDSLVYLPDYKRGSCNPGYLHVDHDWDYSHSFNDCYDAGSLSEYDPMANWINIGKNEGLQRIFVDENVLDGVEYTYAVTAFDIGMKSFNVDFLSTSSSIADEKCEIDDLLTSENYLRPLLELEGYCESLPSCEWNVVEGFCQYRDGNHCSGNDSYCKGMECCSEESGCCINDNGIVNLTKSNCDLLSGIDNHKWLPDTYLNKTECEEEGFNWIDVNHGYEDYSYKELCETSSYRNWEVVEYSDENSCNEIDVDYGVISEIACGEISGSIWYGLIGSGELKI